MQLSVCSYCREEQPGQNYWVSPVKTHEDEMLRLSLEPARTHVLVFVCSPLLSSPFLNSPRVAVQPSPPPSAASPFKKSPQSFLLFGNFPVYPFSSSLTYPFCRSPQRRTTVDYSVPPPLPPPKRILMPRMCMWFHPNFS